jgi:hypothetical protein
MATATALPHWRLGRERGARQFFSGYVVAVQRAGFLLADEPPPPLAAYAAASHGAAWGRRVAGYAFDLADEAFTRMETR